jgi:hypothetical protein
MVSTQITKRKNADTSETLIKHIDGTILPCSGPNLTTMLSGVTDPFFVLKRIDNNGNPYPLQARDQTEFTIANFDTVWNLLLSSPDQPFGKL